VSSSAPGQIPLNLPLKKGRLYPPFEKGEWGDFLDERKFQIMTDGITAASIDSPNVLK